MLENNKLIVCLTPFQMFLAEKIISKDVGKYTLIFIEHGENEKNNYYFNLLSEKVSAAYRYNVCNSNGFLKLYFYVWFLIKLYLVSSRFDTVYLSTINDKHIYILLRFFNLKKIVTFDDGIGNVYIDGVYFDENNNITNYVKERIISHYTIYKGLENIVEADKLKLISFNDSEITNDDTINKVSIFLGQPYEEFMGENFDFSQLNEILTLYKIKYYFPHPRESIVYNGCEYIKTHFIFEDYILDLLKKNSNLEVSIYTFLSSAALNVADYKRVKVFTLGSSDLLNRYRRLYDIFSKKGIPNLEVEFKL
jgi:beta-galactosamide-alpha-2,3-sialyltransferase